MMKPEELEALADRVEADAALPAYKQGDLERVIFASLGAHVLERRGKDRKAWWYSVNNGSRRDDHGGPFGIPRFLSSLDAAASVMPAGWWCQVNVFPNGLTHAVARLCRNGPEGWWWESGDPFVSVQSARDECAARVAAGLRARAHQARAGAGAA